MEENDNHLSALCCLFQMHAVHGVDWNLYTKYSIL